MGGGRAVTIKVCQFVAWTALAFFLRNFFWWMVLLCRKQWTWTRMTDQNWCGGNARSGLCTSWRGSCIAMATQSTLRRSTPSLLNTTPKPSMVHAMQGVHMLVQVSVECGVHQVLFTSQFPFLFLKVNYCWCSATVTFFSSQNHLGFVVCPIC